MDSPREGEGRGARRTAGTARTRHASASCPTSWLAKRQGPAGRRVPGLHVVHRDL